MRNPTDYSSIAKRIKPVEEYEPEIKVVLYGRPGTGKTTLASTFPKPMLFIDISEKGTDSIRDVDGCQVIRVREWNDLELLYYFLQDNADGFKSVCIDTVSAAQQLAIRTVIEGKGMRPEPGRLGSWGTMMKRDWGRVAELMNPFLMNMRDLPLNIVFVAHDRVFNVDDEESEAGEFIQPSIGPRLMPSVASGLNASVGVIGQTFIRERTIASSKDEDGKKKPERKVIEYCLRVGPHSVFITKARKPRSVEMPEVIVDPSFEDIEELIGSEGEQKKLTSKPKSASIISPINRRKAS